MSEPGSINIDSENNISPIYFQQSPINIETDHTPKQGISQKLITRGNYLRHILYKKIQNHAKIL